MRSLRWMVFLGVLGLLMPACSDDTTTPPTQDGKVTNKDGGIPRTEAGTPLTDGGSPRTEAGNPLTDGGTPPTGDGGCVNECTDKARQCSAGGWQACVKLASGCTAWGSTTTCNPGEICSGGQCMKNCINQCSVGARMCSGTGYVTCAAQSSGCTDWGTVTPCNGTDVCSGGQCVKNCADQCTKGGKQCSGTGVQTCDTVGTGCTDWGNPVPCIPGEICSGGVCVQNCSNQCTANATICSGPQLQICKTMASGCTDWDTPQPCATGSCVNGKCDTGSCVAGTKRCNGTTVEECDAGGFWVVQQICPQACSTGACTTTVACSAVSRRCNGDVVEECNPTGTAWLYLENCPNGCTAGLCAGGCTPGATRCNGTNLESCKTDGSGWQVDKSCSTTFCTMLLSGGAACAELELKMDNTSQTLDGEHVYAGDVILKNNSAITVGAKGWLRIRAKNVDIDATSSIQAPTIGDDPAGRGLNRQTKSCYYYGTRYYDVGGTGGGYGSAGSGATYTSGCTVSLAGGPASGAYIADIHPGSRGGSCTNANGGGMIDLIASQKLTVSGNLKADGGTSGAGGGSYCAGGSGGGIRLVAEDLNVNGVLSTAGGSPLGGQGRIKLLYGSKHAIAATSTGVVEQSLIPPMNLRSSTHPDQTRFYNDGYANFNVSWTRPFSSNAGYFYDLTSALPTSQAQVPDTQSTWLTTESESFTPDKLKTGDNYYNVIAVGAGAATGTVEGAFRIQINSTTPAVTSSSHPSQTVWYNLPTAFFDWTNPQADENFVAYYFAFDRYADTIPTKADSKLPVGTKTTYKPNLPAGSIWYFHVLSEDTMGYLTKTARHFKVQIGPDPGMGGISGDIREDGSSPPTMLDGVKVSLNRGLLTTNTANGGKYFFSNNVPAIVNSYELRAEKAGYETFTKQITVVAGQNTSLNILLKKLP